MFLVKLYVGNYNIEYGLVNVANGSFKSYTNSTKDINVVWIEFLDLDIGKLQSNKFHVLFNKTNPANLDNNPMCCKIISKIKGKALGLRVPW